jgi:hypothetical protein
VPQHADAIFVGEIYILFPVSREKYARGTIFIFLHLLHEIRGGRSVSSISVEYVLIMNGKKCLDSGSGSLGGNTT